jgi:hypothetical protein
VKGKIVAAVNVKEPDYLSQSAGEIKPFQLQGSSHILKTGYNEVIHLQKYLFFVLEISIKGGNGNIAPAGDFGNGSIIITHFFEDFVRGIQDGRSGDISFCSARTLGTGIPGRCGNIGYHENYILLNGLCEIDYLTHFL